jgi:hypothetical protein
LQTCENGKITGVLYEKNRFLLSLNFLTFFMPDPLSRENDLIIGVFVCYQGKRLDIGLSWASDLIINGCAL